MRICSLLPSATEMFYLIGAGDDVVGVTHECDFPAAAQRKPIVVRSLMSHDEHSSAEVDRLVRETLRDGRSLYTLDVELLARLAPDLIVTQELCEVCAIDQRQVAQAIAALPSHPRVMSLHPHTLEDVLQNVLALGEAAARVPQALAAVAQLRQRIAAVRALAATATHRPRVVCLEWLEPLMGSGHWVPEMVQLAGGVEPIGRLGQPSVYITWDALLAAQSELLILMPCGMPIARATEELELLTDHPGWRELPAVRDGRVYLTDASSYYNRSGPRLVDGLEILAALIHPELFPGPLPAGSVMHLATAAR